MANTKSITILDCSKVMDPSKHQDVVLEFSQKLGEALSGIGFAYLINTGVDMRKVRTDFIVVGRSRYLIEIQN